MKFNFEIKTNLENEKNEYIFNAYMKIPNIK